MSRTAEGTDAPTELIVQELERIEPPAVDAFLHDHVRRSRPVILTGLTKTWRRPAAEWTLDHMATRYGEAHVVAAVLRGGTLMDDPTDGVVFRRVPLRELIASFTHPGSASHYVMAPTWNFPAEFQGDYRVPPYCERAHHMRAKVWVGKGGTVTPMHRDVPHNLHVHLTGRKRWLLFAPGDSKNLYSRGLFSGMPNFSSVDPEHPDYVAHPSFRAATAFGATLEGGETLFIPHGWWHHTRSLDDAVSMNFWWGGRVVQLASQVSTLFKRARGIRKDEWG